MLLSTHHSVEEEITAAIENTVDFGWVQSSGCSLHHHEILDGTAQIVTKIQGGSNMTGTDLCVNKPHCAAAVRP